VRRIWRWLKRLFGWREPQVVPTREVDLAVEWLVRRRLRYQARMEMVQRSAQLLGLE
jgi:hypothetical protein